MKMFFKRINNISIIGLVILLSIKTVLATDPELHEATGNNIRQFENIQNNQGVIGYQESLSDMRHFITRAGRSVLCGMFSGRGLDFLLNRGEPIPGLILFSTSLAYETYLDFRELKNLDFQELRTLAGYMPFYPLGIALGYYIGLR